MSHIPVVLISSSTRLEGLDKNTLSFFDGTMKKPFSKGEFLEKVKEYVDIKCRKSPRLAVNYDITCKNGAKTFRGRMTNLSHGGMYIETENVLTEGTKVDIAVTTKRSGCFELFGKVAWTYMKSNASQRDNSSGMGIKFLEQDPALKNAVNSLAGSLSSALAPT